MDGQQRGLIKKFGCIMFYYKDFLIVKRGGIDEEVL